MFIFLRRLLCLGNRDDLTGRLQRPSTLMLIGGTNPHRDTPLQGVLIAHFFVFVCCFIYSSQS
ncbi:hypothetical protein AKJ16_DCAP13064 [Drosera capensis]